MSLLPGVAIAFSLLGAGAPKGPMVRTDSCQTKCFEDRADCIHRCGTSKPCAQACAADSDACIKECARKKGKRG